MEIIEFKEYIHNLDNYLLRNNHTVIVTSDKTYCLQGEYSQLSKDYCEKNNIEILKTRHFGGTIINFKEDLCIGNFQNTNNDFGKTFMLNLTEYLIGKKLLCELKDNDLLVEGFKCASYMTTNIQGTLYTAIHISIGMDLELIKNICIKQMKKIPKGLSDFGITRDEIKSFILSTLEGVS